MIAVVDYGVGNLYSLTCSLGHIGAECAVTREENALRAADRIILPGVGAFGDAAEKLHALRLDALLCDLAGQGKPLMGICLGMQLLFDKSYEYGEHAGLGLIPGEVRPLAPVLAPGAKVPHMGWNSLDVVRPGRLLHGIEPGADFYFVHSYYVEPAPELVMATTVYGKEFCSVYGRDGLWAVQCHLEKSGRPGLTVLRNFYDYCDEVRHA